MLEKNMTENIGGMEFVGWIGYMEMFFFCWGHLIVGSSKQAVG